MTEFNQLSLFDFIQPNKEQPRPEERRTEPGEVKEGNADFPDLAPLQAIPTDAVLQWRSYSLSCYISQGKKIFTLLIPTGQRNVLRDTFLKNGIDADKSWKEISAASGITKKPVSVFGPDERLITLYGETGNIKGRYALRPVCPLCNRVSETVRIKNGQAVYDCGHESAYTEVILPGWQYAQHVFEILTH